MTVVAAGAAIAATKIRISERGEPAWYLYSGDADAAPDFLAHLVAAMITMMTLAVSVTMVVLTLAAQQLGSRLIQNFIADRFNQFALGLFVATVIYLLLVLRTVYGIEDSTPNLAVTLGTALVICSAVMVLVFVHHLARSIIADNVVHRVGRQLDAEIERLLPEPGKAGVPANIDCDERDRTAVRAACGGYIQAIDIDAAVNCACAAGARVDFVVRAGHHVVERTVVAWIHPARAATDKMIVEIAGAVLTGSERTPVQDLEYSIRHLSEVAVRALSPGINDPYTAMAVVDRLAVAIGNIMARGPALNQWRDQDGEIRVVTPVSTFEGIVDAAFLQIRQRAAASPDVLIRLAEKLAQLLALADNDQRRVLAKHLRLVMNVGRRSIGEPMDLESLEQRVRQAPAEAADAVPLREQERGPALR